MALTNTQIKAIKPTEKTQKLFDGGGLYVEVPPKGSKRWRLKYRFGGKEKLISLGVYPQVGLKEARERRHEAKTLLADGVDPSENKKAQKASISERSSNSFEVVAREWISQQKESWAESHARTVVMRLENNVFPFIGAKLIEDISPPDLLEALRKVEARGALETAHRIRGIFGKIFRYAIATGRISSDPSRDLRGALQPVRKQHLPAITEPDEVASLLQMIEAYKGAPIVSAALRLSPLIFVRPGELRQAEWDDIDLENAEWRYIVQKTKTQHIVPLATQAISILKDIYILTGRGRYVFPSARTFERPMSDNAILAALRSLGIPKEKMCGHGFRAMARTLLDEVLKIPPHLIEHQLAHTVKDPLGRAYNRTTHLDERKGMMQRWADYLDELKKGEC